MLGPPEGRPELARHVAGEGSGISDLAYAHDVFRSALLQSGFRMCVEMLLYAAESAGSGGLEARGCEPQGPRILS